MTYQYTIYNQKTNTYLTRSMTGEIPDFSMKSISRPGLETGKYPIEFNQKAIPKTEMSWEYPVKEPIVSLKTATDIEYPRLFTKNKLSIEMMGRNVGRTGKPFYESTGYGEYNEPLGTGKQIGRTTETVFRTTVKQYNYGGIPRYENFEYIHVPSTEFRPLTYEETDLLNKAERGLFNVNVRLPGSFTPPGVKQFLDRATQLGSIGLTEYFQISVNKTINRNISKNEQVLSMRSLTQVVSPDYDSMQITNQISEQIQSPVSVSMTGQVSLSMLQLRQDVVTPTITIPESIPFPQGNRGGNDFNFRIPFSISSPHGGGSGGGSPNPMIPNYLKLKKIHPVTLVFSKGKFRL
jgi:hypothetical protein